jgi:tRNA 2-thiouridine synthesizing protein E
VAKISRLPRLTGLPEQRKEHTMTTATIAGKDLIVDDEGFLQQPDQWDRGVAEAMALELDMTLTDRHWLVIDYMRDTYLESGQAPTIRSLGKQSGVPVKELYQLFPKGPAKLAAKLAGIPKPHGCI